MFFVTQCAVAFICAIIASILLGTVILPLLKKLRVGQNILGYVDNHVGKSGTTTMGGIIFAVSSVIVYFLFSSSYGTLALLSLAIAISYLVVGFLDDYIKIKTHKNEGLTPRQKLFFQAAIAFIVAVFVYTRGLTDFFIPFLNRFVNFGIIGAVLVFFVFIATTNCVNLTDGLDGLAGGVSYVYLLLLFFLICVQLNVYSDNYLLPEEVRDLAFLCIVQSGSIIGFLLYNTFSASVFMGDTGSLYLGGLVASTSVFGGNTFFIPFFGIMFVTSGISVIMQVVRFKRTGKRLFLMAPLHHHFEYKGYSESKIVFAYKLITLVVGLTCIITVVGG